MEQLEADLKQLIVDTLFLEDVEAADIDTEEPLFGDEGLALDSIDALEIGVELYKRYSIKIDPEDEELKNHFASVRSLARFVASHRSQEAGT